MPTESSYIKADPISTTATSFTVRKNDVEDQKGTKKLKTTAEGLFGATPMITPPYTPEVIPTATTTTEIYYAREDDTVWSIAKKYFKRVNYYEREAFQKELIRLNKLKILTIGGKRIPIVRPGQKLIIPGITPIYLEPQKPREVEEGFTPQGVYLTADSASDHKIVERTIRKLKRLGCNTIVIDVKDFDGTIRYETDSELTKSIKAVNDSIPLPKLVYLLKKEGIHCIVKISTFKDRLLAQKRPDLRLKVKRHWSEPQKGREWLDPSNKKVADYALELAMELVKAGVDEINFDFVRFPPIDNVDTGGKNRVDIIAGFLERAKGALKPYGVRISADVFATIALQNNEKSIENTGQDLKRIAEHVDAIYLMAYPSHYALNDIKGMKNPADHPYELVALTCKRAKKILKDSDVQIGLFLQAYEFRNNEFPYGPDYVFQQLKAIHDNGIEAFIFWDPNNRYEEEAFKGLEVFRDYTEEDIPNC